MTDKHPAPWRYEDDCPTSAIVDADGFDVCSWDKRDRGDWPPHAIGHLMARAPTLLAERDKLLELCHKVIEDISSPSGETLAVSLETALAIRSAICGERDAKEGEGGPERKDVT